MDYQTLLVKIDNDIVYVTLNRLAEKNTINDTLLQEMHTVLDDMEKNQYRFCILQGQAGVFCLGMDLQNIQFSAPLYMETLKRFTTTPIVMIAHVDGKVLAGGMGFVAACDLVLASTQSQFGLSEALWGLVPANVAPFLIRRIGFQKAYMLALTTQTISAQRAYEIHLVDILRNENEDPLAPLLTKLRRVTTQTVGELKSYFRKMWIINDTMEQTAVSELEKLLATPNIIHTIEDYVLHQKLPWETPK